MKIVILAGGTGSIALQTGLYNALDKNFDGIDTKIIVNAYDNGLSTGQVRQVMGGKILGPSDVRKNQTTRLQLENPKSPWLKFLNIRFTSTSIDAYSVCQEAVDRLELDMTNDRGTAGAHGAAAIIRSAIDEFFGVPTASKIDYHDFALANIIYAGLAKQYNYSLRTAASIMAGVMGIRDNVILNDDRSLFLGAVTKSGIRVVDEGDIVAWNDLNDPFVDVFFTDEKGDAATPCLCDEARDAIWAADLIIFSSGTQWSSLIPTYASYGFKRAVTDSSAKLIMIMNRIPDKDSPGQSATDIIEQISPKYIPRGRLEVIVDSSGPKQMNQISELCTEHIVKRVHSFDLRPAAIERDYGKTHSPEALAIAVAKVYFDEYLKSTDFVFDYDDTLIGRGNLFLKASDYNRQAILDINAYHPNISICTGNSIKAINIRGSTWHVHPLTFEPLHAMLTVYADGGINKYEYSTKPITPGDGPTRSRLIECVNPLMVFTTTEINEIIKALQDMGIPAAKIENRGNVVVAIKPIDPEYRDIIYNYMCDKFTGDRKFQIRKSGRTTIEICAFAMSKVYAINKMILENPDRIITYVGDEIHKNGNDFDIKVAGFENVKCLSVKSPVDTAFFLFALTAKPPRYTHDYISKTEGVSASAI